MFINSYPPYTINEFWNSLHIWYVSRKICPGRLAHTPLLSSVVCDPCLSFLLSYTPLLMSANFSILLLYYTIKNSSIPFPFITCPIQFPIYFKIVFQDLHCYFTLRRIYSFILLFSHFILSIFLQITLESLILVLSLPIIDISHFIIECNIIISAAGKKHLVFI